MKLALLNTLSDGRGGGISGDGLSLDLQFAADKTLTARKGPTPVLTRGSTGTFVGSNGLIQSAAINAARFDHTSAGVCRGLLIEESRTNNLKFSENLTNTTNWAATNQTVTLADVGPDGVTNSAAVLNEGTASGQHSVRGAFGQNRPVMGAVSCTLSAFFKAGTRRYILFAATDAGTNGVAMTIDTQTWSVTDAKAIGTAITYTTNRLTNYGGGWYRAELTFTPSAATTVTPVIWGTTLSTFTALDPTYTGNSSTIVAYGVQLEAGSFATSYIPTVASSVVRSADVCSITGGNFTSFYNNTEGTLFANAASLGVGASQNPVVSIESGTSQVLRIRHLATTNRVGAIVSGVGLTPSSGFDAVRVFYKSALSAGPTGADFVINGTQIPDTFTGSSLSADNMKITVSTAGLSNTIISSIRYYKKQLSVSKLQALTA